MKNPIFLTFLFILILCVSQASATTVQNSKYLNTLSAGDSDIFEMKLTADTKNEIGLPLAISKEGEGGLNATTTATPTIQTLQPTTEPTTALTMKAPRPDPTDPPAKQPNVRDFKSPIFDLVLLAICVSLAAMWIYERHQNKKGEKK